MAAKKPGVSPELKKAVSDLLKDSDTADPEKFKRRCGAIDRALKLAAIEARMNLDEGYGEGFEGD